MSCRLRHSSSGFTLIELQISMVLGLFLTAVAVVAFQGGVRSSEFGEAIATIQSNARFALGDVASSVRIVGYTGCSSSLKQQPSIPQRVGSRAIKEDSWNPIQGYEVLADGWLPAMPEGYAGSASGGYEPPAAGRAMPVVGSSAIVLEGAIGRGIGLRVANNTPNVIETTGFSSRFAPGSMALISNCSHADAFHIKSATESVGGGASIETGETINRVYQLNTDYPLDSRVIPYRRAVYFIGETGRFTKNNESIRSLYEHVFPYADNLPVELAVGVDAMVIRYRMQDQNDNTREVAADNINFNADMVVGVRLGLLFSADARKSTGQDNVAFKVAGVEVAPSTNGSELTIPTYPDDDRIRLAFEQIVKIRNRNVGNRFQ